MPGIASNTKWQCNNCGSIFDFQDGNHLEPCTQCGQVNYHRLTVTDVCDFCATGETSTWWNFPCEDFFYEPLEEMRQEGSRGAWLACQGCYELIQADDRVGLAKRSVRSHESNSAIPTGEGNYHLLFAAIRRRHKGFFEHRNGEPQKLDTADGAK